MAQNTKTIKLRAFRIENNQLSKVNSGILKLLKNKLSGTIVNDRRMRLNEDDPQEEEDLIIDFTEKGNFIMGVVIRVCKAGDTPSIPNDILEKPKIAMDKLDNLEIDSSLLYKTHYHFLADNDYVITNLPSNLPIKRFQVYINYLFG